LLLLHRLGLLLLRVSFRLRLHRGLVLSFTPQRLEVFNGCPLTQRSLPLEIGSKLNELAEIVLGKALMLNRPGDLKPTQSSPSLAVADPPCCRRKLSPLLDCSRDNSAEPLRVVIRLIVNILDCPIIPKP